MTILENELLTARIHSKGAELQSLVHVNGLEYMWSGDPAFWPRHSPVLFPIVGSVAGDKYYKNGETYSLPRHGFARDTMFTVEQVSSTEAVFTLVQNEETLKLYPFAFTLKLRYRLLRDKLCCTYEVTNPATETLFFSIGAHPAFALPLVPGTVYEDYYLQFNISEPLVRYKLKNGLSTEETEILELIPANSFTEETSDNVLPLQSSLFYEDAIVLKDLKSSYVTLASDKHSNGLLFDFTGFPYLGIWAAKDAPFVCIEPWCGLSDNFGDPQHELKDKEGIVALNPGEDWDRTWTVQCF